jgi:hypothetical protein
MKTSSYLKPQGLKILDEVEAAGTRFRDEEQRETATAATLARGGGCLGWGGGIGASAMTLAAAGRQAVVDYRRDLEPR